MDLGCGFVETSEGFSGVSLLEPPPAPVHLLPFLDPLFRGMPLDPDLLGALLLHPHTPTLNPIPQSGKGAPASCVRSCLHSTWHPGAPVTAAVTVLTGPLP